MVDPRGIYNSMMLGGGPNIMAGAVAAANQYQSASPPASYSSNGYEKANALASDLNDQSVVQGLSNGLETASDSSESPFNDYDDEFGNYYLRSKPAINSLTKKSHKLSSFASGSELSRRGLPSNMRRSSDDNLHGSVETGSRQADDTEQIDHHQTKVLRRVRRQVYYSSGYNGQPNCHGFPLEINVRSRVKMDQMFPIHGNSQMKKCIRFE